MQRFNLIRLTSYVWMMLSVVALAWVTLQALYSPQSVMDLVHVSLNQNTDAISSIRGVYGGVGVTLLVWLCYGLVKSPKLVLSFLALFWGMYALSRIITIFQEGALGSFGTQWLYVETFFCLVYTGLYVWWQRQMPRTVV